MAARRVIDRDRGWRKLRQDLEKTSAKRRVLVGIQSDDGGRDDGLNNAELAAVHEFGRLDGTIPERSFIRATIDENAAKYKALAKLLSKGVINRKMTATQALEILGQKVVADIRARIRAGIKPDLA